MMRKNNSTLLMKKTEMQLALLTGTPFSDLDRPIIMVYATFLKLKYRGVLFIAVAKDGNNNIFPLAFVENVTIVKYVVTDEGLQFNMDLKNMTCDCLEFQTAKLSCTHAMEVIDKRSFPKSIYCSNWFKKKARQKTYKGEISSVGNEDSWTITEVVMGINIIL
ncbi:hypothetical protein HAX54_018232 [Datura stramonium]|uniref:SWIM-type domain-containing protein n=1 Tax=Datura stramonium TaxID=4076 RepID=A0ABS8UM72_DATST|nr:hypothetical protein [Datura stramonium]